MEADVACDGCLPEASPGGNQDSAWLQALELSTLFSLAMAVKAAVNLNVFEILAKAGTDTALSAREIVAGISTSNPHASIALDRILRFLASHSVLTASLVVGAHGEFVRKYSLTPRSKCLLPADSGSCAPILLFRLDKLATETWYRLEEAVRDSGNVFAKVHGKDVFHYVKEDLRSGNLFNSAMANFTKAVMHRLLHVYDGFSGLSSLVDVGGGLGAGLSMIIARNPHIRGINFDLPHVIATAPPYPGVQHVGGDMFESVPPADAVFIKNILHDWSDELCVKLLRNCREALPANGKVIVIDAILPMAVETGLRARLGYHMDVSMLAFTPGGKERTEEELRLLVTAAGFAGMHVTCTVHDLTVVEIYKEEFKRSTP